MHRLIVTLLILSPLVSLASTPIIGEHVQTAKERDYSYLCRINTSIETDDGEIESVCSGTLISPNRVVTAAHCFAPGSEANLHVTCGNKYMGSITEVHKPFGRYWNNNTDPREKDVAVITLKKPSPLDPIPYAEDPNAYFNADGSLINGVSCFIAGFGTDDRGNFGELLVAEPKDVNFTFMNHVIEMRAIEGYLKTSVDHGDSGGSLICTDLQGKNKLVGITSAYRYDRKQSNRAANIFTAPWLNL